MYKDSEGPVGAGIPYSNKTRLGTVRVIPVTQIDFIAASGPYAELHVGEEKFIIGGDQGNLLSERSEFGGCPPP